MSSTPIEGTVAGEFCPVGHDGKGVMVDNVCVVAMARRDNIMTGPIDAAVTVNVRRDGELTCSIESSSVTDICFDQQSPDGQEQLPPHETSRKSRGDHASEGGVGGV